MMSWLSLSSYSMWKKLRINIRKSGYGFQDDSLSDDG